MQTRMQFQHVILQDMDNEIDENPPIHLHKLYAFVRKKFYQQVPKTCQTNYWVG